MLARAASVVAEKLVELILIKLTRYSFQSFSGACRALHEQTSSFHRTNFAEIRVAGEHHRVDDSHHYPGLRDKGLRVPEKEKEAFSRTTKAARRSAFDETNSPPTASSEMVLNNLLSFIMFFSISNLLFK